MSRLFITGDTHGNIDIEKLSPHRFCYDGLTKDDILVVLGDWGGIWYGNDRDNKMIKWWANKPWTTFCVLGNHCNYDAIEQLPCDIKFGDTVYKVADNVFLAHSGKVYDLLGKKCLVINGADSHDIFITNYNGEKIRYRYPHISWWEQEQITEEDIEAAKINLQKYNNSVDFVFTHTGGEETCAYLGFKPTISDIRLSQILNSTIYEKHFCGHYHKDINTSGARVLYDDIMMIATDDPHF